MPGPTIEEVFPTAGVPQYTYSPRERFENEVRAYQGRDVLSVFGPTKAGKSVLVMRLMPDALYLRGDVDTAEALWAAAATELELFTERTRDDTQETRVTLSVAARLSAMWAAITGKAEYSAAKGSRDGLRATDDSQTAVTRKLRRERRAIIVDDFHFMPRQEQARVMATLKGLIDRGGKVVVITATHRAQFVGSLVPNMGGRFKYVEVEKWEPEDLVKIAHLGFRELHVTDPGNLAAEIAENSFGSPQLMQRLCQALCRENGVLDQQAAQTALSPPAGGWDAFYRASLVSISPEVRWLLRLTRGPQERRPRTLYDAGPLGRLDGYSLTMLALKSLLPEMSPKRDDIHAAVAGMVVGPGPTPRPSETTSKLTYLSKLAAKPLDGNLAAEDELQTFAVDDVELDADPVLEYQEDGPNSVLRLVDPLFAFALRWWQ